MIELSVYHGSHDTHLWNLLDRLLGFHSCCWPSWYRTTIRWVAGVNSSANHKSAHRTVLMPLFAFYLYLDINWGYFRQLRESQQTITHNKDWEVSFIICSWFTTTRTKSVKLKVNLKQEYQLPREDGLTLSPLTSIYLSHWSGQLVPYSSHAGQACSAPDGAGTVQMSPPTGRWLPASFNSSRLLTDSHYHQSDS